MRQILSKIATKLSSVLNRYLGQYQAKHFLSMLLVVFMLFPSTLALGQNQQDAGKQVTKWVHQNDDSDRPKTTREWNQEARQTDDAPGDRLKRIGEESAEAVKDWGSLYPDTAKRSASELKDNAAR